MKISKILSSTTILVILCCISCKAQTEIAPLNASSIGRPEGIYYNDIYNELDRYEGTWKYENGNTSFTIKLEKKEMVYYEVSDKYKDGLFGEYKYVEDGIETMNFLPNIQNIEDVNNRNIGGGYVIDNNDILVCSDCTSGEKRVILYFNDPERDYLNASIILQFIQAEEPLLNQEGKIKATIIGGEGMMPDENSPEVTRVRYGEYIMIKQ